MKAKVGQKDANAAVALTSEKALQCEAFLSGAGFGHLPFVVESRRADT